MGGSRPNCPNRQRRQRIDFPQRGSSPRVRIGEKFRLDDTRRSSRVAAGSCLSRARRSLLRRDAKITPFLWFDGQAEEAVAFYLSVFQGGRCKRGQRLGQRQNLAGLPSEADQSDTSFFSDIPASGARSEFWQSKL